MGRSLWTALGTEQEIHHVAVFDHVFLALCAHLASIFGSLLAAVGNKVFKGNGLGPDVAFFKVGVDHPGRLRTGIADMNRLGTHLFNPSREIGLQPQQAVRRADQAVQARLTLA